MQTPTDCLLNKIITNLYKYVPQGFKIFVQIKKTISELEVNRKAQLIA